jgi:hypothetical protein
VSAETRPRTGMSAGARTLIVSVATVVLYAWLPISFL